MKIIRDKWYVVHPAHSGPSVLKVIKGEYLSYTATDDINAVLRAKPREWKDGKLLNFNHLDYVYRGPYNSKEEAYEECRYATGHNFALWGSADDDKPGDNNRR